MMPAFEDESFKEVLNRVNNNVLKRLVKGIIVINEEIWNDESLGEDYIEKVQPLEVMHALYENFVLIKYQVHFPHLLAQGMILKWDSDDRNDTNLYQIYAYVSNYQLQEQ